MNRRLTTLLLAALLALPATAQRVSRDYLDTPMTQVLSDLAHAATQQRIVFIHNDLEDFTVTQRFDSLTIAEAIGQCIGFYPIRLTAEGDTLLLVECTQRRPYRLIGRLVDEHGAPVSYANITLLSATDSAHIINKGVSNQNGRFVIPSDSQEVVARFSHVAYRTLYRPCRAETIGTVRMSPAIESIDSVHVRSSNPKRMHSQYLNTMKEVTNAVWSMRLPQFSIDTIPTKYKAAPAVIIADYDSISYRHQELKSSASPFAQNNSVDGWIQTDHLHRTRYLINSQKGAHALSQVVYSKRRDITNFILYKTTVMGIRITKPDGSQRTIDTYPYFKPQLHRLLQADTDTIAIDGLNAGDILDLFVYHHYEEPLTPYRFQLSTAYPVLWYYAQASGDLHATLRYSETGTDLTGSRSYGYNGAKLTYHVTDYDGRSSTEPFSCTINASKADPQAHSRAADIIPAPDNNW